MNREVLNLNGNSSDILVLAGENSDAADADPDVRLMRAARASGTLDNRCDCAALD